MYNIINNFKVIYFIYYYLFLDNKQLPRNPLNYIGSTPYYTNGYNPFTNKWTKIQPNLPTQIVSTGKKIFFFKFNKKWKVNPFKKIHLTKTCHQETQVNF